MKKIIIIAFYIFATALHAGNCLADGTVDFDGQVMPIIKQRPFFAQFLLDTFEFDKSAIGVTIGRNVSRSLSLTRVGPYQVCARLRSEPESDPCSIVVIVNTNSHFFNKNSKEIDGPYGANSVKETFSSIEVNSPGGGEKK